MAAFGCGTGTISTTIKNISIMDINELLTKEKINGVRIEHLNKRNKAFYLVGKWNNAEKDKKKIDEMAQILANYYNKKWAGSSLYKCFSYVGLHGEYCVLIKRYSIWKSI